MTETTLSVDREIIYPDSDGQPMADNTLQYRWIVLIKENLEILFAENPHVFVAGDLLWYAVEGEPGLRYAPDVMVAVGRPKGDRGSYQQWLEDNIAPQVVFEIISPGNRKKELERKLAFYERYGVEEYYIYNPHKNRFTVRVRQGERLLELEAVTDWISLRLKIRFRRTSETLEIYRPNGQKFFTSLELEERAKAEAQRAEAANQRAEAANQRAEAANQRAEAANQRAEVERQRAEEERQHAEAANRRAERLAARLKALGIDTDLNESE